MYDIIFTLHNRQWQINQFSRMRFYDVNNVTYHECCKVGLFWFSQVPPLWQMIPSVLKIIGGTDQKKKEKYIYVCMLCKI